MNYAAVTVPIQTVRRISVRWWAVAAYALVIVLAYGVRAATFDRYLPLMDYSDESNMLLLAMDLRGTDEVALAEAYGTPLIGEWLAGYPPLYPWMNVWTQRLTEQYTDYFLFPGDYIYWLRVVSVAGAVLTVVLMLPLGYALARPLGGHAALFAGLLAAIPWAIAPVVVEIGTLAIPDSFIYPACVLALLGGVLAIQQDRGGWLVVSLLGGIAGIYLKYSLIFALIPAGGGAAVLLYKRVMSANTRGARRRGFLSLLPWFIIMAVLSAYTASFLVFQHGALGLENQEAEWFRENGWANMFSVGRNFHNARLAVWAVMNPFVWVVGIVLGGIGWVYSRRRRLLRLNPSWLWLLVPYTLGNLMLTSSVVLADDGFSRIRWVFPAAIVFSIWWGQAIAQAVVALYAWARKRRNARRFVDDAGTTFTLPYLDEEDATPVLSRRLMSTEAMQAVEEPRGWEAMRLRLNRVQNPVFRPVWRSADWIIGQPTFLPALLVVGALTVTVLPMSLGTVRLVERFALPDTRYLTWQYTDASLNPAGKILMTRSSNLHPVWNRPYSGYDGATTFDWAFDDNPSGYTPEDLFDIGVGYFAMNNVDFAQRFNTPEMAEFIDRLTLLKVIEPEPGIATGNTVFFYRVLPPQTEVVAQFGDRIRLEGYDLSAGTVSAGETLRVRPYWRATGTPSQNYSMFVHFYPSGGEPIPVAQYDGPPAKATRLTVTWDDPVELIVGAEAPLTLPNDLVPGDYTLALGLYDFQTGQRLRLPNGSDRFEITVAVR